MVPWYSTYPYRYAVLSILHMVLYHGRTVSRTIMVYAHEGIRVQIEHYLKNDLKYKHTGATGKLVGVVSITVYYVRVHMYVRTYVYVRLWYQWYTVYYGTYMFIISQKKHKHSGATGKLVVNMPQSSPACALRTVSVVARVCPYMAIPAKTV